MIRTDTCVTANKYPPLFWLPFAVLTLLILVKLVAFNYFAFNSVLFSSLWRTPWSFWGFYLPKVAAALGIGSLLYLFKNKYWSILILLMLDVWLVANLMYMRSYGLIIDAYAFTMIGNLNGFESSLVLYLESTDILFPMLTILWGAFLFFVNTFCERSFLCFGYWIFIAISCSYIGQYAYVRQTNENVEKNQMRLDLFSRDTRHTIYGMEMIGPTKNTSILHTLLYDVVDLANLGYDKRHPYQLTFDEQERLNVLRTTPSPNFETSLIILIIESFEDWVFQPEIMPNLTHFCATHHILYADKITSQVRGGMSADGQMIINTGLLPLKEGAACYRFPFNTYPGIMKHSKGTSVVLIPHAKDVWNQEYMSLDYGYDTTVVCSAQDEELFSNVKEWLYKGYQNVQVLTMSTHTPFKSGACQSKLVIDSGIPELIANYIKSFNTMDAGLGQLLEAVDTDSILAKATIVITGDHKIFTDAQREELNAYIDTYAIKQPYCPLIIYSPNITHNIKYENVAYQMDVYPTILDVMGVRTEWRGLGQSLLTSVISSPNIISLQEMSDKIIRSNYFVNKVCE